MVLKVIINNRGEIMMCSLNDLNSTELQEHIKHQDEVIKVLKDANEGEIL